MDQAGAVATRLVETATSDPDAVDPEEIGRLLADDRAEMRNTALKALVGLAADDVDRVVPFVDDAVDALEDPYGIARSHAGLLLWLVAEERPGLVEPATESLVSNLRDETPLYRFRAARAVAALGRSRPAAFVEHVDALVGVVIDGPMLPEPGDPDAHEAVPDVDRMRSAATTEVAANVLAAVADEEPVACRDHLPALLSAPSLEDQPVHVRGAVVDALGLVAGADPNDALDDRTTNSLLDLLSEEPPLLRSRAIRTLGYARATEAVGPLRDVAENDPDEDVRALAAETADWLADAE